MEPKQVVLIILTAMFLWFGYSVRSSDTGETALVAPSLAKADGVAWVPPVSWNDANNGSVRAILRS